MTRDEYVAKFYDQKTDRNGETYYLYKRTRMDYHWGTYRDLGFGMSEEEVTEEYEQLEYLRNKVDAPRFQPVELPVRRPEVKAIPRTSTAQPRAHYRHLDWTKRGWKDRLKEAVLEFYGKWRPNAED